MTTVRAILLSNKLCLMKESVPYLGATVVRLESACTRLELLILKSVGRVSTAHNSCYNRKETITISERSLEGATYLSSTTMSRH